MTMTTTDLARGHDPLSSRESGEWSAMELGALALAMLAPTVLPARPQTDDLDVLKVIPENYKLLLDNPFVRVIEARVPPAPWRSRTGTFVASASA